MRIVTLRNFGWLTLAMMVAFAAISIRSELRGRHMHDYGRLVDHQLQTVQVERKPMEVVEEASPAETPAPAQQMVLEDYGVRQHAAAVQSGGMPPQSRTNLAIVGGPEGVTIVRQARRRPQLKGGFGR